MRYYIQDNGPIENGKPQWKVVNSAGDVIAFIQGNSSAIVALAACERLNKESSPWDWYGWTQRLMSNFLKARENAD